MMVLHVDSEAPLRTASMTDEAEFNLIAMDADACCPSQR
jgi:hypothetical protein